MKFFVLRRKSTGNFIGFDVSAEDVDDFGMIIDFVADEIMTEGWNDRIWCTNNRNIAEKILENNYKNWYEYGFSCLENNLVGDLEIVELIVKI